MIAVDTNVIIRLLTGDDAKQAKRAQTLFALETIFIPKTVLLECEWVLRRLYRFSQAETGSALRRLIALPNIVAEDVGAVGMALDWAVKGLDFADALHLASSRRAEQFRSFDSRLVKLAKKHSDQDVRPP